MNKNNRQARVPTGLALAATLLLVYLASFATSANAYVLVSKWGDWRYGTSGGTVTWSFDTRIDTDCGVYACTDLATIMQLGYEKEVQRAFYTWESVADIAFQELAPGAVADIGIGIHTGWGIGLGAYPPYGNISFNKQWPWGAGGIPIFPIALHEVGHNIGLGHTDVMEATMYPSDGIGYQIRYELAADDIAGARALYGARIPVPAITLLLFCGFIAMRLGRRRGSTNKKAARGPLFANADSA